MISWATGRRSSRIAATRAAGPAVITTTDKDARPERGARTLGLAAVVGSSLSKSTRLHCHLKTGKAARP
jgi:hypothetical protein